jgi:UTP--glucose-1-phosphate uridylyltransferase
VAEVAPQDTSKYGILDADPPVNSVTKISGLVEKPKPEEAPSNLAIIGRYILTPEIFDILEGKEVGAGGEIQITDAMARLLKTQDIYGYRYEGTRFDCGNKAGFQMANLAYSMDRPDMRDQLLSFMRDLVKKY